MLYTFNIMDTIELLGDEYNGDNETALKSIRIDTDNDFEEYNEDVVCRKEYDLFVCHSGDDMLEVRQLCNELEERYKLKCMIADRDFDPGKPISDNVRDFMEISNKVLILVTPTFLTSHWCRTESLQALDTKTSDGHFHNIIPVLFKPLETEMPPHLKFYTYIDRETTADLAYKIFEAYRKAGIYVFHIIVVK